MKRLAKVTVRQDEDWRWRILPEVPYLGFTRDHIFHEIHNIKGKAEWELYVPDLLEIVWKIVSYVKHQNPRWSRCATPVVAEGRKYQLKKPSKLLWLTTTTLIPGSKVFVFDRRTKKSNSTVLDRCQYFLVIVFWWGVCGGHGGIKVQRQLLIHFIGMKELMLMFGINICIFTVFGNFGVFLFAYHVAAQDEEWVCAHRKVMLSFGNWFR